MTRYVPIPSIDLDPRNEREVVELASLKVFEASEGLLSDFSESSPLRAIIEGQAFAYNEFLAYFNSIPEALLVEWIGPFLGAQRRAGSSAWVEVVISLNSPASQEVRIPQGFTVASSTAHSYALQSELVIAKGQISATGLFQCTTRGSDGNCPAGSITEFQPIVGVSSVTNPEPGYGGSDVETLQETQERFLSLMRRKVPTSQSDWKGVFQDLFGADTVLFLDADRSRNVVTFYVRKPNLEPLSETEIGYARGVAEELVPMGFSVRVANAPDEPVIVETSVGFQDLNTTSKEVSDRVRIAIISALQSGGLPQDADLLVSDLQSYVAANLGIGKPYLNPVIKSFKAYVTPPRLEPTQFRKGVKPFAPDYSVNENDIIDSGSGQYFAALQNFNPNDSSKNWYANQGLLRLEVVREYEPGSNYSAGEVIRDGNAFRVVLNPFQASGFLANEEARGLVSIAKVTVPWSQGTSYTSGNQSFNPDLIEATNADFEVDPVLVANSVVWVVQSNFTRGEDTTTLGATQSQGLVSLVEANVLPFSQGNSYLSGDYILTPEVPGVQAEYDPASYYVSPESGVVQRAFRVLQDFNQDSIVINQYEQLQALREDGFVQPVQVVETDGTSYQRVAERYRARIRSGEKVYTNGQVYLVAREFTPYTQNVEALVESDYLRLLPQEPLLSAKPLFEINAGDILRMRYDSRTLYFKSKASFTAAYNPEVYLPYLTPVGITPGAIPFFDPTRTIEDTLKVGNSYFRVIRPFTPQNQTVRELEAEGYLQRLQVKADDLIQVSEEYLASPGETFVSVSEKGREEVLFFHSNTEDVAPLYRGECLF